MLHIVNNDGLIGDFLGAIPAMQALGKTDRLVVQIHPEAEKLVSLIHNPDNIIFTTHPASGEVKHTIYSATAFPVATGNNWYMSQAYFRQVGLEVPLSPPRAILEVPIEDTPTYDYIISPFARSLPEADKWPREKWQELVDSMPDKKFCVLGTVSHDSPHFLEGPNVDARFDFSFRHISNLMLRATKGLISVVTGTSHLAFHLGVKNWVLNNQDFAWGTNPDGHHLRKRIPDITVNDLKKYLEDNI